MSDYFYLYVREVTSLETDFSDGVRLILLTGCLEVRSTGFIFEVLLFLSLIDWILFFI